MPGFRADDRVLLLAPPSLEAIASLARILLRGVLVVVGSSDFVDRGRQAFVDFDNLMFIEADGSRIPWRDGYFTKIVMDEQWSANPEVERVLAPGGSKAFGMS